MTRISRFALTLVLATTGTLTAGATASAYSSDSYESYGQQSYGEQSPDRYWGDRDRQYRKRRPVNRPVPPPAPPAPPIPPPPAPPGTSGTVIKAYITAYGWPDNDPPGTAIANPVIHRGAGGVGTFADPITIAVYKGVYAPGTKFYIPNVRRYFIVEDTCSSCNQVPSGAAVWVDMWVGGNGSDNSGVLACENAVTGNFTIVKNPDANRAVVPGALWNGSRCTAQYGG